MGLRGDLRPKKQMQDDEDIEIERKIRGMTLPDLRIALRGLGLSPAGGLDALRERLLEATKGTEMKVHRRLMRVPREIRNVVPLVYFVLTCAATLLIAGAGRLPDRVEGRRQWQQLPAPRGPERWELHH